MSDLSVLGVLGLPGAGKTTGAAAVAASRDDVEMLTMSDVAGSVFDDAYQNGIEAFSSGMQAKIRASDYSVEEVVPSDDSSQALATFADVVLDIHGSFFSERAVERVESSDVEKCVVDGIRSTADAEGFDASADSFQLVYIHTPFSERLSRLQSRGRDAERTADAAYLVERDEQELSWGVDTILLERQPEMFYNTFESEDAYCDAFAAYVRENKLL